MMRFDKLDRGAPVAKDFKADQARADDGKWTAGGGSSGTPAGDTEAKERKAFVDTAKKVGTAAALLGAAALLTATGAAPAAAVVGLATSAANQMLANAALVAGEHILTHLGFDVAGAKAGAKEYLASAGLSFLSKAQSESAAVKALRANLPSVIESAAEAIAENVENAASDLDAARRATVIAAVREAGKSVAAQAGGTVAQKYAGLAPYLAKRLEGVTAALQANPAGTPGHEAAMRDGLTLRADLTKIANEDEATRLIKLAHARPQRMGAGQ